MSCTLNRALKGILMKAHQNGVAGAEIVTDVADLLRREPMLSPAAKAAVWVLGIREQKSRGSSACTKDSLGPWRRNH